MTTPDVEHIQMTYAGAGGPSQRSSVGAHPPFFNALNLSEMSIPSRRISVIAVGLCMAATTSQAQVARPWPHDCLGYSARGLEFGERAKKVHCFKRVDLGQLMRTWVDTYDYLPKDPRTGKADSISTCEEYLEQGIIQHGTKLKPGAPHGFRYTCPFLKALLRARGPKVSYLPRWLGESFFRSLPARPVAYVVKDPGTTPPGETLLGLQRRGRARLATIHPEQGYAEFQIRGVPGLPIRKWGISIELSEVGRTDINGDGIADVLLHLTNYSLVGSFYSYGDIWVTIDKLGASPKPLCYDRGAKAWTAQSCTY